MEDSAKTQPSNVLSENRETVRRELALRLGKQEMVSGLFSFLGYGPQAFLLKDAVPHHYLWAWLAVVIAAEMSNAGICFALQRAVDQPVRRKRLTLLLMFSLALSGSVWGSVILLPGVVEAQTTWALQQVAIGIVAIAGAQALAASPGCLSAFTLGILAPTILSGLFGSSIPLSFGIAAIGLFIMCQLYGLTMRQLMLDSIGAELRITKAKETAETANRAKSVFLSNMSHELRTPLNAILGYTQLLSRQDNMTTQQLRQLDVMHASGEHLLTLISDILDLSKIEAQKMELSVAPFSLEGLLEQVVEIMQPRAKQKGLELSLDKDSSLPSRVIGDERRVRQILLNLLANAVKFTSSGRVQLRVRYTADTLDCEVEDSGGGIPADKLNVIFEPFTQLEPNQQGRDGTGLGLPICRRLAALMDGTVTVTSRVGQGSTFRFTASLPATLTGESVVATTKQKISGYRGDRKHVLVVDDNPVNTALLSDILVPLGFEVRTAANGREAIQLIGESIPDLVLLDLVMPEMDGVETATELRRHPEFNALRIIGVSATITDGSRKQAFSEVCDAFLGKPIQFDELFQTIGRLLDIEWETTDISTARPTVVTLTADMLAGLEPELRKNLGKAALSLDSERISALIPQIASIDTSLASTLSNLIKRYDYQSILNALGEESA